MLCIFLIKIFIIKKNLLVIISFLKMKNINTVIVNLQVVCKKANLPKKKLFQHWLNTVIIPFYAKSEITIRFVDKLESHKLNLTYRNDNKPTNILSFPFDSTISSIPQLLGDLVICQEIVEKESYEQGKTIEAHLAHIVIHGTLHLLGYKHYIDKDANKMELLEIKIMHTLGYTNPYLI